VPASDFLLEHMSRTLWDPVDPKRLGRLEPEFHARVNGEIYRFADDQTLARFRRDPRRWCGILRDPVSGMRFVPTRRSPRFDTSESPYFFVSDSTCAAFRQAPRRYEIHRKG
jgi:YHS domain-containing protein